MTDWIIGQESLIKDKTKYVTTTFWYSRFLGFPSKNNYKAIKIIIGNYSLLIIPSTNKKLMSYDYYF